MLELRRLVNEADKFTIPSAMFKELFGRPTNLDALVRTHRSLIRAQPAK